MVAEGQTLVFKPTEWVLSRFVQTSASEQGYFFSTFLPESFDFFELSDLLELSDFCESSDFDSLSFLEDESPLEEFDEVAEAFLA